MKEFILDCHMSHCSSHESNLDKNGFDCFCELNPHRFLFFLDNKFGIVTYFSCMENYDEYGWKMTIINQIITNNKIYESYKVNKSISVAKELANFRKSATLANKVMQQVNYIYADNAGREYAITTKTKMLERLMNNEDIQNAYIDAKEFILEKGYKHLLPQLENLYINNSIGVFESDIAKTIPHLIKLITKKTKQNATS